MDFRLQISLQLLIEMELERAVTLAALFFTLFAPNPSQPSGAKVPLLHLA